MVGDRVLFPVINDHSMHEKFNIFLSPEKLCTLLLVKKKKTWKSIFNTNSELSQNSTKKHIMLFKTTVDCLFNDIWCYSVIGCFDWKTVVRGLLHS